MRSHGKNKKYMFRKIISNLPFSPALVGKLGVLARHLKKEELSRRLGLIFAILTLVVQFFVVFQPSESANAGQYESSTSDIGVICPKKNPSCKDDVKKTISATNMSQGFEEKASSMIAHPGDHINYTLYTKNTNKSVLSVQMNINMSDVLEYSEIIDFGGGSIDRSTKELSWPVFNLSSNQEQTRTVVIKILDELPSTAQGVKNTNSYDCRIQNVFGNSTSIDISCPALKVFESIVNQLPVIDSGLNISFTLSLFIISLYFFFRTRQLEKEVRLVRKNINSGTV